MRSVNEPTPAVALDCYQHDWVDRAGLCPRGYCTRLSTLHDNHTHTHTHQRQPIHLPMSTHNAGIHAPCEQYSSSLGRKLRVPCVCVCTHTHTWMLRTSLHTRVTNAFSSVQGVSPWCTLIPFCLVVGCTVVKDTPCLCPPTRCLCPAPQLAPGTPRGTKPAYRGPFALP